jgi:hypothetical protein
MAKERDEKGAFDYFMDNLTRLQADQRFREVLRELDQGQKETLSLIASDPAAFLRYRGVQIPQDFRISVKKMPHDAAVKGGGGGPIIMCDCVEVCFLRYCVIYCYCKIFEYQEAASR